MTLSHWRFAAVILALVLLGVLMFVRFAKASPLAPHVPTEREKRIERYLDMGEKIVKEMNNDRR